MGSSCSRSSRGGGEGRAEGGRGCVERRCEIGISPREVEGAALKLATQLLQDPAKMKNVDGGRAGGVSPQGG